MVQHADIDHTGITGAGGSVATDAIWDAAGDLVQGSGANTAARLAIGTAGQVLKVNAGATAVEWDDESGGSTELLAYKTYAATATLTATTGTLVDADATNLAVAFTAPASTNVLVRLTGTMRVNAAVGTRVLWGLREGTSVIAGGDSAGQFVGYAFTASVSVFDARSVVFPLLAIAGGAHTYKWAIGCTANGGGLFVDAANPATMEVWALP